MRRLICSRALTRAKFFLFVIARCDSIVVNPYWGVRDMQAVVLVPMKQGNNKSPGFPDLVHLKIADGQKTGKKRKNENGAQPNRKPPGRPKEEH